MAKTALSESKSETTEVAEATGDIIEGNPNAGALAVSGAGVVETSMHQTSSFPS